MKVGFISLGCAKNQVNCEQMIWQTYEAGYEVALGAAGCDVAAVSYTHLDVYKRQHIPRNKDQKASPWRKCVVSWAMTWRNTVGSSSASDVT